MKLFEDYPDYAMMTNDRGERNTKPWVSGQSPLAMGLMSAGLGILAAPDVTSEWVGGSGRIYKRKGPEEINDYRVTKPLGDSAKNKYSRHTKQDSCTYGTSTVW